MFKRALAKIVPMAVRATGAEAMPAFVQPASAHSVRCIATSSELPAIELPPEEHFLTPYLPTWVEKTHKVHEYIPNERALSRLEYLTTHTTIDDSNAAWAEVMSCLHLVDIKTLSHNIQCGLLSSALERLSDHAIMSTVEGLLKAGINVNAQDAGGNSAIYLASTECSEKII